MSPESGREATIPALVHLYRAEVARADLWRVRLDSTTNWALTASAAAVSIAFGTVHASHAVFIVAMGLVLNFLVIETRRYRTWDVYLRRVRLLETGFYAALLRNEPLDPDALHEVASMLDAPRVVVPFWLALGQRVKRTYGVVLLIILLSWLVKLLFDPESKPFFAAARIGFIPGGAIFALVCALYGMLGAALALTLLSAPPETELMPARRRRRPLSALLRNEVSPGSSPRPSGTGRSPPPESRKP